MSLEICILASGSMGNSTILRTPHGAILIDVGIGPRVFSKRLASTGVDLSHISAICLTHLDRDHFNASWVRTIVRNQIRILCHENRIAGLKNVAAYSGASPDILENFDHLIETFNGQPFSPLPHLTLTSIPLAHDLAGSHGFIIEGHGARIGYATDLGHVPPVLFDRFVDLDILALESNYDLGMQDNSTRPWFLKQRIMGGKGHLSNEQAFAAIREILNRCEQRRAKLPAHIVLLHRSRECNCPNLLRKLFSRDKRVARRLTLADQFEPTAWLSTSYQQRIVGEQLALAWA